MLPFPQPIRFVGSFTDTLPAPELPEIAFAGRSNVGKSSAINVITGVGGLARVSKTPGRTQALNLFNCADRLQLVDLPGYGHAKVAREKRLAWGGWVEAYLFGRPTLKLVVALVDSRHDAQELQALVRGRVGTLVIATKVDDLPRLRREDALARLATGLGVARDQLLGFSATEGIGVEDARRMILSVVPKRAGKR
jgi:GTP-binding protein